MRGFRILHMSQSQVFIPTESVCLNIEMGKKDEGIVSGLCHPNSIVSLEQLQLK